MVDNSLMIEDYSDVVKELEGVYGDLIDEELLQKDRTISSVSVFIPEIKNPAESVGFITSRFETLSIPAKVECIGVSEEDWADSWKKYYKMCIRDRYTYTVKCSWGGKANENQRRIHRAHRHGAVQKAFIRFVKGAGKSQHSHAAYDPLEHSVF